MILNLTQHPATPEQIDAGVVDLIGSERERLIALLTFTEPPNERTIVSRALKIAEIAVQNCFADGSAVGLCFDRAMIGGAPWLMAPLERELRARGIEPVYAFSVRAVEETVQADGQ